MDYEKDIRIEESALDVEWLDQSSLMFRYAQNAAECRRKLDLAKEALDFVRAELDKEIRTSPEDFGIEKVTEAVVQNAIITQERYKEANVNFINRKFEADIAQGAVRAVDARKDALENLVRLNGQQYFAGPKMPRDLSKEREDREARTKEVNAGIASKMRRRHIV